MSLLRALFAVHLSDRVTETVYWGRPADDDSWTRLARVGLWHIVPIMEEVDPIDSPFVIGLRLVPGMTLEQSPVVLAREKQALTIASTPATLVPNLLFYHNMDVMGDEGWKELKANWPTVRGELLELHHLCGGQDNLEPFEAFLHDEQVMETPLFQKDASRALVWTAVDTSPEHLAFRRYVQRFIDDPAFLTPPPDTLGVWTWYAASCAAARAEKWARDTLLLMDARQYGESDPDIEATLPRLLPVSEAAPYLWAALDRAMPIDANAGDTHPIVQFSLPKRINHAIADQASALTDRETAEQVPRWMRDDPLWFALSALGEQGSLGYRGAQHVETAAVLDSDRGEPERSLNALISAAYWWAVCVRSPNPLMLDAAIYLARKRGWSMHEHLVHHRTLLPE